MLLRQRKAISVIFFIIIVPLFLVGALIIYASTKYGGEKIQLANLFSKHDLLSLEKFSKKFEMNMAEGQIDPKLIVLYETKLKERNLTSEEVEFALQVLDGMHSTHNRNREALTGLYLIHRGEKLPGNQKLTQYAI
jgi:hypothetical protein